MGVLAIMAAIEIVWQNISLRAGPHIMSTSTVSIHKIII